MGVKQSKRSVDITEISTKGEIEGFGNEGKVEKIIDGVVEKVAANGHVDGDLQNGVESHQNGEAAAVPATEKMMEKKDMDETPVEGVVNGTVENGEVQAEAEKTEEIKKSEEKKEKKKEKKEKVVKKKFSFRNFSFSKKDKTKSPKEEEKTPEKAVEEVTAEEALTSPEKEEVTPPAEGQTIEMPKPEIDATVTVVPNSVSEPVKHELEAPVEVVSKGADDLPPPLPASPPPSEPVETKIMSGIKDIESCVSVVAENSSGEINEIESSVSNISSDKLEEMTDIIKNPEQMAFETGKQIEEKATNLLKAVEKKAEESMRTVEEAVGDVEPAPAVDAVEMPDAKEEIPQAVEDAAAAAEKLEELAAPVEISNLGSLTQKLDESSEKTEEGAGESLADIPKDLTEEVTAATIEMTNPDSLEVAAPVPPPDVEPPTTGE